MLIQLQQKNALVYFHAGDGMSNNPSKLFKELWSKYQKSIYRYFRREFSREVAEDLCQQTYLKLWEHIETLHSKNIFQQRTWLFTVAKNVRNDYLRYKSRHQQNFIWQEILDCDKLTEPDFEESLLIHKAIDDLIKEDKELLNMAQYLTSNEIGEVLGISASAVRSRIQKSKQHLYENLKKYNIEI